MLWLLGRKGDGEDGPLPLDRLDLQASAVFADDPLSDAEPEPRALFLGGDERLEYLLHEMGRDAGAVVAHADDGGLSVRTEGGRTLLDGDRAPRRHGFAG